MRPLTATGVHGRGCPCAQLTVRPALLPAAVRDTGSFLTRPLFCDATLRSPLKRNGEAHPRAAKEDGAVLERAVRDKQTKYWDLEESSLADLVVLAGEIGGR